MIHTDHTSPIISALMADLAFILLSLLLLMVLFTLCRTLLLLWNRDCTAQVTPAAIMRGYLNGVRFDLQVACIVTLPLWLAMLLPQGLLWRGLWDAYLVVVAFSTTFALLAEAEFYRQFQARLNSIVIQYLSEDFKTVSRMIWVGTPVVTLVSLVVILTLVCLFMVLHIDRWSTPYVLTDTHWITNYAWRVPLVFVALCVWVLGARGTLRQGAPLRWGDAFTTGFLFTDHLGLNGITTLFKAWRGWGKDDNAKEWKRFADRDTSLQRTRQLILQSGDTLLAPDTSPLLRKSVPQGPKLEHIEHVVFIMMESFSSRFVGAQGAQGAITPYFDQLSQQGCLCRRLFSVGTHTHQGLFGTFASFPNLPDYEYLMQQPAGSNQFSGFARILSELGYRQNAFVYNGDFAWDNQRGFFGAQGMTHFVGRDDYINPIFKEKTWGVCDEDMFRRGLEEIDLLHEKGQPFYGLLQSLSNHMPYVLPDNLPIEAVTGYGDQNKRLTAMRYSDWALGQFFQQAKTRPWYPKTLFVVLGDHGFYSAPQVTSVNLQRFHIPGLFLAPGIQQAVGPYFDKTASQLDMVNTAISLLGKPFVQSGWGRNLFALAPDDPGYAMLKPSGSDKTVAMVSGDEVIVKGPDRAPQLWRANLGFPQGDTLLSQDARDDERYQQLGAWLQTALLSLQERTTGHNV